MSLFKFILERAVIPVTDAIIHIVHHVLERVGRNLRQVNNRVEGEKKTTKLAKINYRTQRS